MSINYEDRDNYSDLAESITTAGRPVSCIKGKKKKKTPHTPPFTNTEQSK